MKNKPKSNPPPAKARDSRETETAQDQSFWKRLGLRLAAIFLIIVFLASECAALLPVE